MIINLVAGKLATLALVIAGGSIILSSFYKPLRTFAVKLLLVGCVLAAAAALIPPLAG